MKHTKSDGPKWQRWWLAALAASLATPFAAAQEAGLPLKISGGDDAVYGDHPGVVSLQILSGGSWHHRCGGAIWNRTHVVTAAHCLTGAASTYRIVAGEHDLDEADPYEVFHSVASYQLHPRYEAWVVPGAPYDVAIVRLTTPLSFNSHVSPIIFATGDDDYVGLPSVLVGLGRLGDGGPMPGLLQELETPVISNDECRFSWFDESGVDIWPEHICTYAPPGEFNACPGDDGSPITAVNEFGQTFCVGIFSWGECEGVRPAVFSRSSRFTNWITVEAGLNGF